jgi:hypothetical protein
MIFHLSSNKDPLLNDPMELDYQHAYNLSSKVRINGLGEDGISFLNTSLTQDDEHSGYLGAAVLAINTLGRENIKVLWKCSTISPAEREYAITFQYKIGTTGSYTSLESSYEMADLEESQNFEIALPKEVNNQEKVYLRWKYHFNGNQQGKRAELALDNIYVLSDISTSVKSLHNSSAHFNFVHLSGNVLKVSANLNEDYQQPEIEVLNLLGNKIISKNIYSNTKNINEQINIASLPQGQYFVVIRGKNSYILEKFILLR